MRYVVDGCNLLGASGTLGKPGAARAMLGALERFCRRFGASALVVFDALEGLDPGGESWIGERVCARRARARAGLHRADREIVREVHRSERGSLVVVTDDCALAREVERLGARVLPCAHFARRVRFGAVTLGEKEQAAEGIDNAELLRLWTDSPLEEL